jgi:hypothetical protein
MEINRQYAPVAKNLILNPLGKHMSRMGKAIWVYLYLLIVINDKSGRAIVKSAEIAKETGISENNILTGFGILKKWNYIDVKKQNSTFVITVCKWKKIFNSLKPLISNPKPYSDHNQIAIYIADILQEKESISQFISSVKQYSSVAIHSCLQKTVMVPKEKIKKSRTALFLYFLKQHEKQK